MSLPGSKHRDVGAALRRLARKSTTLLAAVGLIAGLWFVVGAILAMRASDVPREPEPPPRVGFIVVEPIAIPLAPRYLATSEASRTVQVRSRVRGFLESQTFQEGGSVEPGQVLFTIDPKPFEAELAIANARLASAEARRDRAEKQHQRYIELLRSQAATEAEVEEWETQRLVAEAEVELERAGVAQAELNVGYTTITSPLRGVVGRAQRDVGSYVDDGSNSLLAIIEQVDPIDIRFTLSEREILRWRRDIQSGRISRPSVERVPVIIELADGSNHPALGVIDFVDIRIDPTTASAVVRASTPNPGNTLRPGQSVHAVLFGFERPQTVVVPREAVMQTPMGSSVYVLDEDGRTVRTRPVVAGDWVRGAWIIEQGLAPGDRVIIDGLTRIQPGMEVDPRARTMTFDYETPELPTDEDEQADQQEEPTELEDLPTRLPPDESGAEPIDADSGEPRDESPDSSDSSDSFDAIERDASPFAPRR